MKLEIKKPCNENWDNMKIGLVSRHCDVCDKGVMDFTKMNRGEIISYMLSNPNDEVCGRMHKNQFDFRHDDIPVLIEALRKQRPSNSFMIIALVCISLASCSDEQPGEIKTPNPVNNIETVDHSDKDTTTPNENKIQENVKDDVSDLLHSIGKVLAPEPVTPLGEIAVAGGICVYEPDEDDKIVLEPAPDPVNTVIAEEEIMMFAEHMPEFTGGSDELFKYIKSNLNYPKYERDNNIQGNVYVQFVVEKDGSITAPNILRSVKGSKNFDSEVLRILKAMPNWVPAVNQGKTVRASMTLPIRFSLTN